MYSDFCLKVNISSHSIFTQTVKEEGKVIYRTDTITIAKTGCIVDKSGRALTDAQIVDLYKTHGLNISALFDGLYNLVVVDTKLEKAFIFHDHICGSGHIFYTFDGENIFISSSIKNIINSYSSNEWMLDEFSIEEFVDKGYLTGNRTLIYNIFKTPNNKYTEFNLKNGLVADRNYFFVEYDKKDNITSIRYNRILNESVSKCLKGKYAIGLSNDYDSVYTVFHARKIEPDRKTIKTYSAFSSCKKNAQIANEICKSFDNVESNVTQIHKNVLDFLPLIVYITEGTAFDCNAFKDFEIARMLKRDGASSFVSSDGVDAVFTQHFYEGFDKFTEGFKNKLSSCRDALLKGNKHSRLSKNLFADKFKNGILIQSALIYNYFDVRYFNVYIFRKYLQTVYKKVTADSSTKFHQQSVRENVAENVLKNASSSMKKIDVLSLFTGEFNSKDIALIASKSYFSKKYKRQYTDNREKADYCLRIIYLELFQTIFVGKHSDKMLKTKRFNYSLKAFFPKYFTKENEI